MKRKIFSIFVCVLIVLALLATVDFGVEITMTVEGATITVDDSGGADHLTIQAAINAAIDGDTIFVFSGTYIENIIVNKIINLVGESNTATKIDGSWGYVPDVVKITCDYVTISNFYITNDDNPDTNGYGDGIKIDADHITVSGNIVYGGVNGIYLNPSSNNCTIAYNNVTWSWYYGIYCDSSDDIIIEGNTVDTNHDSIEVRYGTRLEIFDNLIKYNSMSGIYLAHCTDSNVYSNTIKDNRDGIVLGSSSGIKIFNNLIIADAPNWFCNHGVALFGSDENHIINNNATKTDYGVFLDFSDRNVIEFNDFYYSIWEGLYIRDSSNNTIRRINSLNGMQGLTLFRSQNNSVTCNKFTTRYGGPGMVIEFSIGNNIAWNTIYECMWGLNLLSSSANEIVNNIIKDNSAHLYGWAIHLEDSQDNVIKWNNITNNDYGVYLLEANSNTISKNHIKDNDNGIHSESSANNLIYHNNIISNSAQAYDDGESNFWDNSYPSGGNYWSDYLGVDLFSGPDQNISGSDGIGDTSYSIDSNSSDQYPLMTPYMENYTILREGWNLVSIPLIPDKTSLDYVLESISGKYDAVQWYNSSDTNDPWKHFKVGKPFGNDLAYLNESLGFWIHITQPGDTIFLHNGTQPTYNHTIPLYKGWNMVGYPSLTNHNRTVGLNQLDFGVDVDCIQWFDSSTKTWHFLDENDSFEIGRGYWIHSKVNTTWEVPL